MHQSSAGVQFSTWKVQWGAEAVDVVSLASNRLWRNLNYSTATSISRRCVKINYDLWRLGNPRSKCWLIQFLMGTLLLTCRQTPSHCVLTGWRGSPLSLLVEPPTLSWEPHPLSSKSYYLSKAPSSNTITLGARGFNIYITLVRSHYLKHFYDSIFSVIIAPESEAGQTSQNICSFWPWLSMKHFISAGRTLGKISSGWLFE